MHELLGSGRCLLSPSSQRTTIKEPLREVAGYSLSGLLKAAEMRDKRIGAFVEGEHNSAESPTPALF